MRGAVGALAVVLLLPAAGCAPELASGDLDRGTVRIAVERGPGRAGSDPVTLTYLGVGGWLLDTGRSALLTAPLLSRPDMLRTGFGTIATDTAQARAALRHLGVLPLDDVAAILVGHGHYDHLLDVPWLAVRHAPRARILANATVARTLAPFVARGLDPARVEDVTGAAATVERPGRWIRVAPDLRVMPVLSDHAPHFQGRILYHGHRGRPMPRPPRTADEWLDGQTLAFVIEVLAPGGGVRLRLYYQDAVARAPRGLVPRELAPVDLALVVPATYAEVDWQPEALLENTRPRHVLVAHWESFFVPVTEEPEPVLFTRLPDFLARLHRAVGGDEGRWWVPVPGTRFVVEAGGE